MIDSLGRRTDSPTLTQCGEILERESEALRSWYRQLGDSLAHGTPPPPPVSPEAEGPTQFLACVREGIASGDAATRSVALAQLWASQYLGSLGHLQSHLRRDALDPPMP
jgi:hypothetical protein